VLIAKGKLSNQAIFRSRLNFISRRLNLFAVLDLSETVWMQRMSVSSMQFQGEHSLTMSTPTQSYRTQQTATAAAANNSSHRR
jgi:hypothetical protein